ncbi:unnamed protein product [Moneuplotes crassus]|uniref:Uncharacterized protein n=1 Tax=Euplotes crassus TaxID=5936 RepID=A0AAD1U433_EUPCR|nr:unnamed protein product [Moneuplotes crassus]
MELPKSINKKIKKYPNNIYLTGIGDFKKFSDFRTRTMVRSPVPIRSYGEISPTICNDSGFEHPYSKCGYSNNPESALTPLLSMKADTTAKCKTKEPFNFRVFPKFKERMRSFKTKTHIRKLKTTTTQEKHESANECSKTPASSVFSFDSHDIKVSKSPLHYKNMKELKEENRVQEVILNSLLQNTSNPNPILQKLLTSYTCRKYEKQIMELKSSHHSEIEQLKSSYTSQVETLQLEMSDLTTQVEKLEQENSLLKTESTQNLEKLAKNLEVSEHHAQELTMKLEKLLGTYKSLKLESKQLVKTNSEQKTQIDTLESTLDCCKKYCKEIEADNILYGKSKIRPYKLDVDPYELHKRLRQYESKNEILKSENIQITEKLDELKGFLQRLRITEEDLKTAMLTGSLKLEGFNSTIFDIGPTKSSVPQFNNHCVKRKRKCRIRKTSTMEISTPKIQRTVSRKGSHQMLQDHSLNVDQPLLSMISTNNMDNSTTLCS